ncbi:MAG TPA: DUF362 domain-containing protein [Firmicutes bacterium]|nr:DUF362 domain-containing protein [Bacillota bacterium]
MNPNQSRRAFLQKVGALGASLPVGLSLAPFSIASAKPKSRVAQIGQPDLLAGEGIAAVNRITWQQLLPLVEEAVRAATGQSDIQTAWRSLVSPKDIIGLKVNTLAGRGMSTRPAVAFAIAASLTKAGIPAGNIIIWDRSSGEMRRAGYPLSTEAEKVRCFGSDSLPEAYEGKPEVLRSVGSCFATLVSRYCTALINVPVLKDHDLSGITLGMKNFYGVIHNPNKYHDNHCDPYIADLSSHPYIREKLRLVIADALLCQYNGGPSLKSQWTFPLGGILAGTDPVAVDRVGALIVEQEREKHEMPSLEAAGRPATHIATAARLGLGTDQPDEIEWIVDSG